MQRRKLITGWPGSYVWNILPAASGLSMKPFGVAPTLEAADKAATDYLDRAERCERFHGCNQQFVAQGA